MAKIAGGTDYLFPYQQGGVLYEGLVSMQHATAAPGLFWGRIYESAEDNPLDVTFDVPSYELVLTSERPDLPPEKQPATAPAPPISSGGDPRAPLTPWSVTTTPDQQGVRLEATAYETPDRTYRMPKGSPITWTVTFRLQERPHAVQQP